MPSPVPSVLPAVRAFRALALAEACSWVGLLVGMAVKYGPPADELGVKVFGPVHGALFVAYLVASVVAARTLRWELRTLLLALVASVPPLGTIVFERWALRTGRLSGARPGRAAGPRQPSPSAR